MENSWHACRNILCIRADNMGDLLMSSPAIRALKETFSCKITVLTSSMAVAVAGHISGIDATLTYDFPWVKTNSGAGAGDLFAVAEKIKQYGFDAVVIFTVYSQNPLPAIMLAYLAAIPLRLAYCRENPYELLTHWVPDKEPYSFIRHQVVRDLQLVATVGAVTGDDGLQLRLPMEAWPGLVHKLSAAGIDLAKPWLVLHAGVSEKKRTYPTAEWIKAGSGVVHDLHHQVLLTGTAGEKELADRLEASIGPGAYSLAGRLDFEEFMLLIHHAPLVVSVNTGTIHLAAATGTPLVVLYALTNPQHLPWKAWGKALLFSIPEHERSKNEVIAFVHDHLFMPGIQEVPAGDIVQAAGDVLRDKNRYRMPELIPLRSMPAE